MNRRVRLVVGTVGTFILLFTASAFIEGYRYVSKHRFMSSYHVRNVKPVSLNLTNAPMLGKPSAPVTIVEYGDFKCPDCMHWEQQVFTRLQKQFINTGEVKLYFEPYLVIPYSTDSAIAGLSIYKQNPSAFWTYYSEIYKHQKPETQDWATPSFLTQFVQQYVPAVSAKTVLADIKDKNELSEINASHAQGRKVGVSGTPTVFVDGYQLQNSFDYGAIQKLVELHLKGGG